MKRRTRTLLLACITILLCISLVAGGTYALFSDNVKLTTHLQAGDLDITLKRIKLVSYELDPNSGYVVKNPENKEEVDFSNETTKNVFDISDSTLIIPGSSYEATMQITNNSDVAFGYWLEIILSDDSDVELASQLKVKVVTNSKTIEKSLENLEIGSETNNIGVLAKSSISEFIITVTFDQEIDNNPAMNQKVNFDLVVHAVQVVNNN